MFATKQHRTANLTKMEELLAIHSKQFLFSMSSGNIDRGAISYTRKESGQNFQRYKL